ncbi:Uma2 family endonuclease [Prochlorothrix hollandica]|uniref:Putative restriction endonuclease domain-containing protein n=1 Tax=Prochlorothrix hollandica PCC 9006 = CALU 1027 TaxID=317619 RepID=A0A0M2PUG6_PROHO|nr:Uma2 family endonuclease [Prochlorothrix hollandica]KKI97996.1 hypothetical protein PROH_19765 [Prochlorothrix hollandica PCC 9006 = CALU 1027]
MIANPANLSAQDYLDQEAHSPTKHEYRQGYAYAMAGASDAHVTIAGNLFAILRNHLRLRGCRVYISDMKARIEAADCYYYPDVMVTCDPRDLMTDTYKRFPRLIVEVLSPSTANFDRGDKFADYQTLDSLQEYVLINSHRARVECFRRTEGGLWLFQSYAPTPDPARAVPVDLQSVDLQVSCEALYEDVVFAAQEPDLN